MFRIMTSRLLLVNGSLRGPAGNTARLLELAASSLPESWQSETLCLADYAGTVEALAEQLTRADAFLLGSGVYWGSWGSPLQRFLEVMTAHELSPCFMGKPTGAVISADSVGGLDVAQRLLGAFSLLGCLVPPLSTVVLSRVANAAIESDELANADVWHPDDLQVVVRNLVAAQSLRSVAWASWPVRHLPLVRGQYPTHGVLADGLATFSEVRDKETPRS